MRAGSESGSVCEHLISEAEKQKKEKLGGKGSLSDLR
jgi:hypothetical protein